MSGGPVAAPEGLVDTVMRTVAADRRPARRLPLADGVTFVADVALAHAIRSALDTEPALLVRRCRVEPGDAPDDVRVWLSIAVSYARFDVAVQDVRASVRDTVAHVTGLPVQAVDIDVVDVFETELKTDSQRDVTR